METSKLNNWSPFFTAIGFLAGLLLVAYEIRQSTDFARAESSLEIYGDWAEVSLSEIETDIGDLYIKSIEDPKNLSPQEIFKLNAYFAMIIGVYGEAARLIELGVATEFAGMSEAEARYYFSGSFARLWFETNRYWMRPENVEVIVRAIESTPVSTKWEYGEKIRSKLQN